MFRHDSGDASGNDSFFVSHRKSYLIKVLSSYKDYLEQLVMKKNYRLFIKSGR